MTLDGLEPRGAHRKVKMVLIGVSDTIHSNMTNRQNFYFDLTCDVISDAEINEIWSPQINFQGLSQTPSEFCKSAQ